MEYIQVTSEPQEITFEGVTVQLLARTSGNKQLPSYIPSSISGGAVSFTSWGSNPRKMTVNGKSLYFGTQPPAQTKKELASTAEVYYENNVFYHAEKMEKNARMEQLRALEAETGYAYDIPDMYLEVLEFGYGDNTPVLFPAVYCLIPAKRTQSDGTVEYYDHPNPYRWQTWLYLIDTAAGGTVIDREKFLNYYINSYTDAQKESRIGQYASRLDSIAKARKWIRDLANDLPEELEKVARMDAEQGRKMESDIAIIQGNLDAFFASCEALIADIKDQAQQVFAAIHSEDRKQRLAEQFDGLV